MNLGIPNMLTQCFVLYIFIVNANSPYTLANPGWYGYAPTCI
jgi:hypothetical protein